MRCNGEQISPACQGVQLASTKGIIVGRQRLGTWYDGIRMPNTVFHLHLVPLLLPVILPVLYDLVVTTTGSRPETSYMFA